MRVILADDHAIVRQGLRSLLTAGGKFEVVGEAASGRDVLTLAEKTRPDAAIMDIAMPELNGLEAALHLRERLPEVKVIILSMYADDRYLYRALKAGACGYVLKSAVYEELALALEAAQQGKTFIGTGVSQLLINEYVSSSTLPAACRIMEKLTLKEREILQLLAEGSSRQEIAKLLCISPKTVDRHRENLKVKLNIAEDAGFLQIARMLGMVGEE
jgi:DNA-binding NarL/FixJ family response regulator